MSELCAVVLAAGAGTRLRPLTELRPKALCPVGNVALLDLALDRVGAVLGDADGERVAVNAHHHADQLRTHLAGDGAPGGARRARAAQLSVEEPEALGTAGAIGQLRGWVDGRAVLVHNVDAWLPAGDGDLARLVEGWSGETARLLVAFDPARADFHGLWRFAGASLLPAAEAAALEARPTGLYEVVWRRLAGAGRLELVPVTGAYIDCGTPVDYLGANLAAAGGAVVAGEGATITGEASWSVIGAGASVAGRVERCVVWPDAAVAADEDLADAIRLPDGRTIHPLTDV